MLKFFFYSFCFILSSTQLLMGQNLKSPSDFLGYQLGTEFSRHHQVVDYFQYLSENNPGIVLKEYGKTYENRPLYYTIITSKSNHEQLESLRKANLARTGLLDADLNSTDIPIVWLSFNIHGNEASSTEASMNVAYQLLSNKKYAQWLEEAIIIIDPCINPDGRDRYVNFYNQYKANPYNASAATVEHSEPWPGGRPNHYLFDLNRDWAWHSQKESKQRMEAYHKWMPHIHVDFHEQYYNSPYYFAPAAEPFHPVISQWQRDFQVAIGQNHAKYFDDNNWLYFTRERFDLFYPSYGDTYPTYNGAIGMTYEQAGHGRAGLGVITEYGDTLTLEDRIAHHSTTALSTIEIAVDRKEGLIDNFEGYFNESIAGNNAPYASYLIKWDDKRKADMQEFLDFLDTHKIKYGNPVKSGTVEALDYSDQSTKTARFNQNDLVISAAQSKSKLIQALFDPSPNFSDSLTYDITAWALPHANSFHAYASKKIIESEQFDATSLEAKITIQSDAYAYLIPYTSFSSLQAVVALLKKNIKLRVSSKDLQFQGEKFSKGSIIITKRNNERVEDLSEALEQIAEQLSVDIYSLESGFADEKYDLGSGEITRLKQPKIAVLMGAGTSSLSYGQIWYYFEQELEYPIYSIRTSDLNSTNLNAYDLIILPAGGYYDVKESLRSSMHQYMMNGGRVVSISSANQLWKDMKGLQLKQKEVNDSIESAPLLAYEQRERFALQKSIFGAVYRVKLDDSHPLAYGLGDEYFSLKTNSDAYHYLPKSGNVGIIDQSEDLLSGFSGHFAHQRQVESLVIGTQSVGRGELVFLIDDPLFRAFWKRGRMLMGNAVFMPW